MDAIFLEQGAACTLRNKCFHVKLPCFIDEKVSILDIANGIPYLKQHLNLPRRRMGFRNSGHAAAVSAFEGMGA